MIILGGLHYFCWSLKNLHSKRTFQVLAQNCLKEFSHAQAFSTSFLFLFLPRPNAILRQVKSEQTINPKVPSEHIYLRF